MEPAHHGTDRYIQDLGDLFIRKSFDIGQDDGQAERVRQGLDCVLDLRFTEAVDLRLITHLAGVEPRAIGPGLGQEPLAEVVRLPRRAKAEDRRTREA